MTARAGQHQLGQRGWTLVTGTEVPVSTVSVVRAKVDMHVVVVPEPRLTRRFRLIECYLWAPCLDNSNKLDRRLQVAHVGHLPVPHSRLVSTSVEASTLFSIRHPTHCRVLIGGYGGEQCILVQRNWFESRVTFSTPSGHNTVFICPQSPWCLLAQVFLCPQRYAQCRSCVKSGLVWLIVSIEGANRHCL